jgi:hypothetical protein
LQLEVRRNMNTSRLLSLLAAVLVTAAQWTALLCLLAPMPVEAAPLATIAYDALPVIVVTAERPTGAAATAGSSRQSQDAME